MNSPLEITLDDCWAKTDPITKQPVLSITSHSLAAGAVAELLFRLLPERLRSLFPDATALLCALHDIGKITIGFQTKTPKWLPDADPAALNQAATDSITLHAQLSEIDLRERLPRRAGTWARAIGAHHGRYLDPNDARSEKLIAIFQPLRNELFRTLAAVFPAPLPEDHPCPPGTGQPPHRLFLLAGLCVVADWIASNEYHFPLGEEFTPNRARELAAKAVSTLRLEPPELANHDFENLFRNEGRNFPPNPLQKDCLATITRPGLYLIEAPMGGGKTEAALAAAHQLVTAGHARGIYFALPTQLTSNEIHKRVAAFLANAIPDASPLALAHASSWLNDPESRLVRPLDNPDAADSSADEAVRWFTSRRALLAPFGVGTIDQALLAILPVKFHQLRFFGLAGKVVIFDEVHSYDAYTGGLLEQLITHLLRAECTVIILSATLNTLHRERLLDLGKKANLPARSIPATDTPAKTIHLQTLEGPEADQHLLSRAVEAAAQGTCVLWIRNTVDLAQQTYKSVLEALHGGDIETSLLHSRYTFRERHGDPTVTPPETGRETDWVERLGKHAEQRPKGCILVTTQIAEQSLDIDADLLITDLAPTDMLWQRIGRLHRHPRSRPAGFEEPRCLIRIPELDPDAAADDLRKALAPHSFIYDPYVLLVSRRLWMGKSSARFPADIGPMLDATYPRHQPDGIPDGWLELHARLMEKRRKHAGMARHAARPTAHIQGSDDEMIAATRISEITYIPVLLLRSAPRERAGRVELELHDGQRLDLDLHAPWQKEPAAAIFLNSLQIASYKLRGTADLAPPAWLAPYSHLAQIAAYLDEHRHLRCATSGNPLPFAYKEHLGLYPIELQTEMEEDATDLPPEDDEFYRN